MSKTLIKNALIINENNSFTGTVLIEGNKIAKIYRQGALPEISDVTETIDATGKWLMPGCIDDQVHFREPGLTHKGTIQTESRAAVAGGITTFMDMPNTIPQTTTIQAWDWKMERAAETSSANYAFFFGGTNDNLEEIKKVDSSKVPGLKLFLGSSTGNMLVDKKETLRRIFGEVDLLIAIHAEKEEIIQSNKQHFIDLYGKDLDVSFHPKIRSAEACYASSSEAVELATALNARLHILHLSTEKEMSLLSNNLPLKEKKITGEVCVHHLWFSDEDYKALGNRIKWNPAIKTKNDRDALRMALIKNQIDIVATDHAPHLLSEKEGNCLSAASGGPLVQHSLVAMLEMAKHGLWSKEEVVEKMAHNPAVLFRIEQRGYIREGYYADLVLVDPEQQWTVSSQNILSKCGWSPFEGYTLSHKVCTTFVNGEKVYENDVINEDIRGLSIKFNS